MAAALTHADAAERQDSDGDESGVETKVAARRSGDVSSGEEQQMDSGRVEQARNTEINARSDTDKERWGYGDQRITVLLTANTYTPAAQSSSIAH